MLYDSKMCDKAVNKCVFVFDSVPDQYKPQEMWDTVASLLILFLINIKLKECFTESFVKILF